jgi:hypothetical protein
VRGAAQSRRRADLHDMAEVENDHPVADIFDHRQIMPDEEDCQPHFLLQILQ